MSVSIVILYLPCDRFILINQDNIYLIDKTIATEVEIRKRGWQLVPEGIIRPVISVLALAWFIRYICYWYLLFLNIVIINEKK